jgi:predicted nuclease of predicted toxin-antitoxin system
VKFLIDMPLSPDLVLELSGLGHDAVHASALGLHAAYDSVILSRAATEQSVVVTADLDYPQLLALSKASEPSVILFRNGSWSDLEVTARLVGVLKSMPEHDFMGAIIVIERNRLRRRKLPL